MSLFSAAPITPITDLMKQMRFEPNILDRQQLKTKVTGDKKVYYCQRCLNHQRAEPRKNHKCDCPYANCTCQYCILVEKRRQLNTKLHDLEGTVSEVQEDSLMIDDLPDVEDDDKTLRNKGERVPNCQKCGQHGRKARLKGHKRSCPFRECKCIKCRVVSERQKLMADQIKIRRRQRKDHLMNMTRDHITNTLNAAAALSTGSFTFNPLIFPDTMPCSLLTSPASSDGSSYSPTNSSAPTIFRTSPELLGSTTTTTTTMTSPSPPSPQGILAPVPINPSFSLSLINSEALLQSLLSYKLLDFSHKTLEQPVAATTDKMDVGIIDVCSV